MTSGAIGADRRPGDNLLEVLNDFLHLYEEADSRFLALPLEQQIAIVDDAPTDMIEGLRSSVLRALTRMHPQARAQVVATITAARQTVIDAEADCDDRLSVLREQVAMLRLELSDHLASCPSAPRGAGPALP